MRKLTFLPFALAAAACGSEDRCDPFLEAMDCVHGQTPVGVRRYSHGGESAGPTVSPSPQIGPSAGDANGAGPSPGSANGDGPSPGSIESSGPTVGSAQGSGPSAGSANPADALMRFEGVPPTCSAYCGAVYTACQSANPKLSDGIAMNLCAALCECFRTIAPECIEATLRIAGPCTERGSCDAIGECLDNIGRTVPEPVACKDLDSAIDECLYGDSGEF